MSEEHHGGCQCGETRYRIDASEVRTLYCCHCTECQRQAASGFGMSMLMPRTAFELTKGKLANWQRIGHSGAVNRANFCPHCGVRIFHDGGEGTEQISLKAGTLDDTSELAPIGHIWTKSAQGWMDFADDALVYETQPDDDNAALNAAYAAARAKSAN